MLILASASPRRSVLLEQAGIAFRVVVPEVEEVWGDDPHAVAVENARRKALAVDGEVVLGADTVVATDDVVLGKPRDENDARTMLRCLAGTTHRVVTGVALVARGSVFTDSVETRVTMRPLSEEEIDDYVASGEACGKAGAYAIQETADRFVVALDGPYDNVVGLPVDAVRALLGKVGT